MSQAFAILIEMENLQQITTRNTAVFQQLSFMSRPGIDTWLSSIHGTLVLSYQDSVISTIITYQLCAFLGIPSFASSWDDIIWHIVCTTGRWDLLKASIVSDFSERVAICTRIGEENSIEVTHISTAIVRTFFLSFVPLHPILLSV